MGQLKPTPGIALVRGDPRNDQAPTGRLKSARGSAPGKGARKIQALKGRFNTMAQSLARLQIHLVFSTKNRQRLITDDVRESLHAYMAAVLADQDCTPLLINSVEDHVHMFFVLARTVSVSQAAEKVKKTSSKWIKTRGPEFASFAWQAGYGAFSVSESKGESVRRYNAGQRKHHRRVTFQEEFRKFLKAHRIEFDEKYVWD